MRSNNRFIYIVYSIIFDVAFLVDSGKKDYKFFPNLPIGEFRINYMAIVKCNIMSPKNKIHYNIYFSKLSSNTTALKGNITYEIALDDSLTYHINMAVKDSIGGWKDNAHILSLPKACTSLKNFFGNQWINYTSAFGIKDPNCPIRPGVYVMNERVYDLSNVLKRLISQKLFFTVQTNIVSITKTYIMWNMVV